MARPWIWETSIVPAAAEFSLPLHPVTSTDATALANGECRATPHETRPFSARFSTLDVKSKDMRTFQQGHPARHTRSPSIGVWHEPQKNEVLRWLSWVSWRPQ
jgi:hypothetical protein